MAYGIGGGAGGSAGPSYESSEAPPDDGRLILQFDVGVGRTIDAVVAAEALIKWVEAIREANAVMDPLSRVNVGLVSADPACLRIMALIKFIERTFLDPPAEALNETPRFKKLVVATVLGMTGGIAAVGGGMLILPDQTVKIAPQEEPKFREQQEKLQQSPAVKAKVREFYKTVDKDAAITGVSVKEAPGSSSIVSVPRKEFPERSGLWLPQEPEPPTRPQHHIWDVVVTYPAMFAEPRVWGFERDGLPFTARIEDEDFLTAMRSGVPLGFREGLHMTVEIVWQERLEGEKWVVVPRSRKIARVLSPKIG